MLVATADGAVELFTTTTQPKLATSATGVTVTGTVAATAYTGDGSALTGVGALQLTVLLGLILGVTNLILQIIQLNTASGVYATINVHRSAIPSGQLLGNCSVTALSGTWRTMGGAGGYVANEQGFMGLI
jgi:hypothetical protein